MSRDALRDTFFCECEDLLDALHSGLATLADGTGDGETVNALFRAVHSIKGAAGAFGLNDLVRFAHRYETVLDALRAGRLEAGDDAVRILLRAADTLADLVAASQAGTDPEAPVEPVLVALQALLGADARPEDAEPAFEFVPLALSPVAVDPVALGPSDVGATLGIRFRPHAGFYRNGHDPLSYIAALEDLGDARVSCDTSGLPPLDGYDVDGSFLVWSVELSTTRTAAEIGEVFAFAEGLCELEISSGHDRCPTLPEPPRPAAGPAAAPQAIPDPVPSPTAPAPVAAPRTRQQPAAAARPTLRVDIDRIDKLVNTVGELIINQAALAERLSDLGLTLPTDLLSDLDDYRLLARDIQEAVMGIRAQPVKSLFQRMSRIVRETAEATGKDVRLITTGEETEVDKTVIEHLADPLTHMIRNAVDHGIEIAAQRRAAGKPERGTVRLSAEHQSGSVIIRIADDGAGLDRARILETAIRKGLLPPGAEPSDSDIDHLLFAPGFSTAAAVTDLSGRGVGMDVVKTAITALGGRVGIESRPGNGSTFSIVLPLTLAVLDGMVVSVAGQTMVVPISCIVETIRPERGSLKRIGRNNHVLLIRGTFVPVIDLAQRLGHPRPAFDPSASVILLVRSISGALAAMAVERISDHRQVVIKSLEENYGRIPGISAATILGDGRIALIVDPETLAAGGGVALPDDKEKTRVEHV
jgi:two-component system, chemotaxis family, sensor kinase CheA